MLSKEQITTYFQTLQFPAFMSATIDAEKLFVVWSHHLRAFPISSLALHMVKGYSKAPVALTDPEALFKKLVVKKEPSVGYESTALFYWVCVSMGLQINILEKAYPFATKLYSKHDEKCSIPYPALQVFTEDKWVVVLPDIALAPLWFDKTDSPLRPGLDWLGEWAPRFNLGEDAEAKHTTWPTSIIEAQRWLCSSYRYPYLNKLFMFSFTLKGFKLLTSDFMMHASDENTTSRKIENQNDFIKTLQAEFQYLLPPATLFCAHKRFFASEKEIDKSSLIQYRHQQYKKKDKTKLPRFVPPLHKPEATSILEAIEALSKEKTTLWVNIAGPAGVGKSTFARTLQQALEAKGLSTQVLGLDSFNDNAERARQLQKGVTWHYTQLNYRGLHAALDKLKKGEPCLFPKMDQATKTIKEVEVNPSQFRVIVFEGIYTGNVTDPIAYLPTSDFSIFMLPRDKQCLYDWKWERELAKSPPLRRTSEQFAKHMADLKEDYSHHIKMASHFASALIYVNKEHQFEVKFLKEATHQKIKLRRST